MSGFMNSSLILFCKKEDSVNFLEKVRVFTLAESLGVESLANHLL
jgi:cystathionine beta-lyase